MSLAYGIAGCVDTIVASDTDFDSRCGSCSIVNCMTSLLLFIKSFMLSIDFPITGVPFTSRTLSPTCRDAELFFTSTLKWRTNKWIEKNIAKSTLNACLKRRKMTTYERCLTLICFFQKKTTKNSQQQKGNCQTDKTHAHFWSHPMVHFFCEISTLTQFGSKCST